MPPDRVARVSFTEAVSLRELRDGSVLVVDRGENRVVRYRWSSGAVTDVTRTGSGPGEYQLVGRLYSMADDLTILTDPPQGRWILLRSDTAVETRTGHARLNRLFGWRLRGADSTGRVLGVSGFLYSGPTKRAAAADSLMLILGDWSRDQVLDTVARLRGAGQKGFVRVPARDGRPVLLIGGNPLDSEEDALLLSDGTVAVARLMPYRVDWRLPDGRWRRGQPLPFVRVEVTDAVRCDAMRGYAPTGDRCDPDLLPGWPELIPPFLRGLTRPALLEDPHGRILVARTYIPGQPERRYDLLSRDHSRVGVLTLPASEFVLGFGAESIYTVTTGEMGLQTLRRHPWPRDHRSNR